MKLSEANILEFRLDMEALITEREGMVAENMQRQVLGQSMAWTGDDFNTVQQKLERLHAEMVNLMDK